MLLNCYVKKYHIPVLPVVVICCYDHRGGTGVRREPQCPDTVGLPSEEFGCPGTGIAHYSSDEWLPISVTRTTRYLSAVPGTQAPGHPGKGSGAGGALPTQDSERSFREPQSWEPIFVLQMEAFPPTALPAAKRPALH